MNLITKSAIARAFPQINWLQPLRGQKCYRQSPDCPKNGHSN